jgi:hypothetical protein
MGKKIDNNLEINSSDKDVVYMRKNTNLIAKEANDPAEKILSKFNEKEIKEETKEKEESNKSQEINDDMEINEVLKNANKVNFSVYG